MKNEKKMGLEKTFVKYLLLFEKQFLFEKQQPEPTALQKQIEMKVTNGLGYDTRTQYYDKKKQYDKIIQSAKKNPDQLAVSLYCLYRLYHLDNDLRIRSTPEGLRIHLAELDARIKPNKKLNDLIKAYKIMADCLYGRKIPFMENI